MLETAKKIRCENAMKILSKNQTENAMKILSGSISTVLKIETVKIITFPLSFENTKIISHAKHQNVYVLHNI